MAKHAAALTGAEPRGSGLLGGASLLRRKAAAMHAQRPFVLGAYRPRLTLRHGLLSLFALHNETMNVWSHLLGTAWVAAMMVDLASLDAVVDEARRDAARVYLLAALVCLVSSTVYHLLGPCSSERLHRLLYTADTNGIAVCIGGGYYPYVKFGFRCHPQARQAYNWLSLCLVVACFAATNCGVRDAVRVAVLVCVVSFGLLPLGHWCAVAPVADRATFLPPLLEMFAMYGVGFCVFHFRLPERWRPGAFDVWGGSHFWWHVAVVLAIRAGYLGCRAFCESNVGCEAPSDR